MPVIERFEQVTVSWLTRVLREAGVLTSGHVLRIELDAGETTLSTVARLRVTYRPERAGPERLFLKFTRSAPPGTRRESGAEVAFYATIAPATPVRALLRCLDAQFDPEAARMHVLLEDVSDTHFAEPPLQLPIREEHAGMVVDELARLHATWWREPPFEAAGQARPSAEGIERRIAGVREQVGRFAGFLGDRLSRGRRVIYAEALAALPKLYERLLEPDAYTVVHDDVHIGNVLYPKDPERDTIRLIDWQTWNVDLALKDLAHLMALFWFPERRRRLEMPLLERYHRALNGAGISEYTRERMLADYRLCVLRKLFHPPWQWATGHHPNIWWNHLERAFAAFDDLSCRDLIDG